MLHIEESGSGPAVVLLHGAPTSPEHLTPLAERLSRSWRVLLVHLPGYGRSAMPEPCSLEHGHSLVEEAVVARGVHEVHLVGFSGGAYRAFALAVRSASARARPELVVRSVASLAGTLSFTREEQQNLVQYVNMLRAGDDAQQLMVDRMLSPRGRANPRSVAEVRGWATAIAPEHLARELESFIGAPDLRANLAALDIPVLARVGSNDAAWPPDCTRRIVEAARRVCFEEVPGVGHALLCEDFEATLASVERHLRSTRR